MAFTKMLWAFGSPIPLSGSWDYWTSVSGAIFNFQSITIQKVYPIIAYYAIVHSNNSYTTIMISPDQNAVVYKDGWENRFYSRGTITDTNNISWYWSGFERGGQPTDMSLVLNDTEYEWSLSGGAQAAQDLLDRIYAVPFQEDYQNAQYTLGRTDKERTIRKALGLWLAFTTSNYSNPNVQYISDNADTIIGTMVNKVSSSTDIRLYIYARYSNVNRGVYLNLYYANNASDIVASIVQKSSYRGLEYYTASAVSPQPPFTNLYSLFVNEGTPTVTESTGTYYFQTIGVYSTSLYDKDTTNMGVDF